MPIVILVLALLAYATALIIEPGFRRWGLVLGASIGLGLAIYFTLYSSETTRSQNRVPPDEIALDQLDLQMNGRSATLTGRVTNGSEQHRLRDMTIEMRLFDCLDQDVSTADCPIIGEAETIVRPDVPPGQIRGFEARFLFSNLPEVAGILRWDWSITQTRSGP